MMELRSLALLLLASNATASSSVRGAISRRQLQDVLAFERLSCNQVIAPCQSFVETFGSDDIKDSTVTIPCGECYTMDHAGPMLTFSLGLDIQGKLVFPESYSLHVVAPMIVVQGELDIYAKEKPVDGEEQVVFTMIGEDEEQTFTPINENANKCRGEPTCVAGKKAFVVAGGVVDIQAIPERTPTWTLLQDMTSDDTIVVQNAENWAPGAEILITSHTRVWNEHQVRQIKSITKMPGSIAIQLNETIVRPTTFVEAPDFATEIALLSRNVLIQGGSDPSPWHGGHFMVHHTPMQPQLIEGVEFRNMGQQSLLGRYPIHFHFCDDSSGSSVSKNTIRESNQRCIVVHGTNNMRVSENIAFDTKGHCFMLEDGMEEGNEFVRNLGAQTGAPEAIIPDDGTNGEESDDEPATFWITNPTNSFVGNVAAGSESSGYWFEPYLRGERKHLYPYTQPMKAPLTLFKDNVAHSNVGRTGAIRMYVPGYLPEEVAVFDGIKSFRNDASGIFLHKNYNILIQNSLFADNNIGIDIDRAEGIEVRDSVIIGESDSYRRLMERQEVDRVCSRNKVIGIDLHTWTIFQGFGGSTLKNIDISGFSNTACPQPRALNMDDHNIKQGLFEHFTTFSNVRIGDDDKASLSFCDLTGSDIETVYLIDVDGSLSPPGMESPFSVLLSNGPNIQKFTDPSNCIEVQSGCYTYCKNTCFRSIRYEIEGPQTEGFELKLCDSDDPQDCAFFFDSRRVNNNRNGHLDPRTFIAHAPVGRNYEATFLTNTGAVYRPSDLKIVLEENFCPVELGTFSISLDGFTNPPTQTPMQAPTPAPTKITRGPTDTPTQTPVRPPTPTNLPTQTPVRLPTSTPTRTTRGPSNTPTQTPVRVPTLEPKGTISGMTSSPTQAPVRAATPPPMRTSSPSKGPALAGPSPIDGYGNESRNAPPSQQPVSFQAAEIGNLGLNESSCFPGFSTVFVDVKGETRLDQLVIGDRVKDKSGAFTPVLSFAHRDPTVNTTYVMIETNQSVLHISPDHLLYVNNGITNAGSVKKGDLLVGFSDDMPLIVRNLQLKTYDGAFAPITGSGHIVVSGVAASSYVMALNKIPASYQHQIWHAAYAPLRLLCKFSPSCDEESYTKGISNSIAVFLPLQSFLNKSSQGVQFIAIGVAFPFVLLLCFVEQLFSLKGSVAGIIVMTVIFRLILQMNRGKQRPKVLPA